MHATVESQRTALLHPRWPLIAAIILLFCSLLLFWPGIAEYDTIVQYQQLARGRYDDWHPPAMARLWAALSFAGHGTAPLFALQMTGIWLGLGLLAQALGGRKAAALLAIGATPFLLGWLAIVVKDSQLVGALALATGLIGRYRLRDRPLPAPALIVAILCLAYATLVRANAAFSTVPLAMLLIPRPRNGLARFAAMIAAIPLILLLSQPVNHGLLGARDSGVRRTQPIYDLAAIAVRTRDPSIGIGPAAIDALAAHHCVKPLFWDPLGDAPACQSAVRPWDKAPVGALYVQWAKAIIAHPLAYGAHRIAHLNSTGRWLVPLHWPLAAPPAGAEPNDLGFPAPSPIAADWQRLAGWLTDMPLGWPVFWVAAALWGLHAGRTRPAGSQRDLATALFLSALFQEASFALLSISSDLRYHLWSMLAAALGWAILWPPPAALRHRRIAACIIAPMLLSGMMARFALPAPPGRYADLMS
jgi:hypothetical protein